MPLIDPNSLIELNAEHEVSRFIRERLAACIGVPELKPENCIFTNGADAALHATLGYLRGREMCYIDFTYRYTVSLIQAMAGNFLELRTDQNDSAGTRVLAQVSMGDMRGCVCVTNPDNRLGYVMEKDGLRHIAARADYVLIDESHGDVEPEYSLVHEALKEGSNILVVRSFSKFFDLEAIRIGYIIGSAETLGALKALVPQYGIATSSIATLTEILAHDAASYEQKRAHLRDQKRRVMEICGRNTISYAPSHTNFITVYDTDPRDIPELQRFIGRVKEFRISGKKCFRVTVADV